MKTPGILLGVALVLASSALASVPIPLTNWPAPTSWTAPKPDGEVSAMTLSDALPFFPITPCRVADTRGNGFVGAYGTPALAPSGIRSFTIHGQCGIPTTAKAVSFNFTVAEMSTGGNLTVYPTGAAVPTVSTINWTASTFVIANAAIVPLSAAGAITVNNQSATTTHLILDVNGFYYDSLNGTAPAPDSRRFAFVNNRPGDVAFFASNLATTGSNTYGAKIWTASSGSGSAGVLGESRNSTGVTYGVHGTTASTTALASGVFGSASGASNYGVTGQNVTASFRSAGVRGYTGAGIQNDNWSIAGVRGEGTNFGVLGVSTALGAGGFRHALDGTMQTGSYLGFSSTIGLHTIGTTSATGTKSFVEPHPVDPNLVIKYVSLEGNEAGTYFRGRSRFSGGMSVIAMPEDFRLVSDGSGLSIQVTPIGDFASVAVVSLDLDKIVLKGSADVEFFYTVNGVRRAFRDFEPIQPNLEYIPSSADQNMPGAYPPEIRERLISNGTYLPDGSPNVETARRLGWAEQWDRAAAPVVERD